MDATQKISEAVIGHVKATLTVREALRVLDRFDAELADRHPVVKAKLARTRRNLLRVAIARAIREAQSRQGCQ